ncbi:glycosyltransferase [Telmatobacter sp. DSM 110680]|uniref:Glycosyltransferase n=1 Tax=Telmatobacter sp. DSM 110680 TaxID=3036704 RepID=A0AAU7DF98_9BACT
MKATLSGPARASVSHDNEAVLTVTIVICSRNRPELLRECLQAVSNLDPKPDEVLVVDNTQGDMDTENAAAAFGARYTIEPVVGLSRARNRGLVESSTNIVAYLDDDAIPEHNWLGVLMAPFEDDNLAASTGRVVTPDSDHQLRIPRTLSNCDPDWFEISTFGGMGLGSNMAFRKSACPQPMFDVRLGRGAPFKIGEESYALARLLSNNYKAVYQPTAIVFHPPLSRDTIEHEARNAIAYWLLLFKEFPEQRMNLLRFLFRRLRHKPLNWVRDPQEPGEIVTSRWRVLLKAGIQALWLFLSTPKQKTP